MDKIVNIGLWQRYYLGVKFCIVVYYTPFLFYHSQLIPRCVGIIQREVLVLEHFLEFPKRRLSSYSISK